jgi:Trk K+ transport system NAD-binding subunit
VSRSQRRLLVLIAALLLTLIGSALLYEAGMHTLEGKTRSFWQSLEWAGETLTTTGYGADSSWTSPLMVVFVLALQFAGVLLVFLIVPIYLIPFLEERFETRLPRAAEDLRDHVVVFRSGPAVEGLLQQLASCDVPTLVIEEDDSAARRLFDAGQRVILGSLREHGLRSASLLAARALVANGSDAENAAVILAARQLGFQGELIAFVEEPFHRTPMILAGATAAFTPRHILGAALAARASDRIGPRLAGVQPLGRHLQVSEIRVQPGSALVGRTLAEAGIGARTGAIVIGQWVGGRLMAQPTATTRIEPNGILVVVSGAESLDRLEELAERAGAVRHGGPIVVAGYGEVGRKVAEMLRDAGEPVRVVDRSHDLGADVSGDVLDPRVLDAAGVASARAVVLALDNDSATLFATVIVKDRAPAVSVIARVNEAENVERIYAAGADFALSISQVSGQMLARRLLGEEAVEIDAQLKVRRVAGARLAGHRPADLRIRERTGCSVVAVERGDEVLVDFGPDFRFERGDAVYVTGSTEAVGRFEERFGPS